jgi:sugar phosphate isomerase/epimerase
VKALLLCDNCQLEPVASLCKLHGVGIEIQSFYDPEFSRQNPQAVSTHRGAISSIPLRSVHGPFADLCPGSFDALVRDLARQRFNQSNHVARKLGAIHVVLHHGYVPGTSETRQWLNRSQEFWKDFLKWAPPGIHFHLENMLEHDPEVIAQLVDDLDCANLDICLDVGHAHCFGKVPVLTWIERLGNRIGYVHLNDNQGQNDDHLGLGRGTIPMMDVCKALRMHSPNAVWALETKLPDLEDSILWLKQNEFLTPAAASIPA